MTKKQSIMLAIAGATAFAGVQAQAGYSGGVTFGNDDLLISFRQATGTGTTDPGVDATFDLGNINTFLANDEGKGFVNLNGVLAGANLTGLFGGSLNNVFFSATAANVQVGAGQDSIWTTRQRSETVSGGNNNAQGSSAWTTQTAARQSTPASHMNATGANAFGVAGTAFGTFGATVAEGTGVSYLDESSFGSGHPPGAWGSTVVFPSPGTEVGTGSSFVGNVRGDFYSMVPGTTTGYLGFFQLDNAGDLSFYSSPVPEPATYGILAGLGSLIFAVRNRFRKANA